jgi:hypothetical protein
MPTLRAVNFSNLTCFLTRLRASRAMASAIGARFGPIPSVFDRLLDFKEQKTPALGPVILPSLTGFLKNSRIHSILRAFRSQFSPESSYNHQSLFIL